MTKTTKRHLRTVRAGEAAETLAAGGEHSGEGKGATNGVSALSARQSKGEDVTTAREPTPEMRTESTEAPRQVNGHDARMATEQANRLLRALGERGVRVDVLPVRTAAESYVALNVLVNAGLITNDQVNALVAQRMAGILANTLQAVEEQHLQMARKPQPVRGPGLIVPGRQ